VEEAGDEDQMGGTADRKDLGEALDNAEDCGVQSIHEIFSPGTLLPCTIGDDSRKSKSNSFNTADFRLIVT
jgi:hypothetical protein